MHADIQPAILYFGTPVVLVTTLNEDRSTNIAPISSIWWLGWSSMIGIDASSQTTENLIRRKECVLNLPSADLVEFIDRIAKTTGRKNVPLHKRVLGYRYEKDKFSASGLTPQKSISVNVPRVRECPVQLEARLSQVHPFGEKNDKMSVPTAAFELDIEKVHVEETLLDREKKSHVDPDKWHPLIMSFRKFYSTGNYIHHSTLSEGSEDQYAPWKKNALIRRLTELALFRNTKLYRKAVGESVES